LSSEQLYYILRAMKIIVTHGSPDMDAITSVWLIRRFLPRWDGAVVKFVPAGERLARGPVAPSSHPMSSVASSLRALDGTPPSRATPRSVIERIGEDEVIHVDTGLGPLDHHQTADENVCGASLTWEYIKKIRNPKSEIRNPDKTKDRLEAINRMVKVVVDMDHFKEVFWKDPTADYYEFCVASILDGLKLQKQDQDDFYVDFISDCLDAILHEFENRIWAEKEIKDRGIKFDTRFGKGIGFETINDSVIKLSQKMGYVVVIRKDPRKGYVRVKARPSNKRLVSDGLASSSEDQKLNAKRYTLEANIDLTLAYEKLKKMDPQATWFLHVSKKMLLNGSVKNPKMRPTRLGLSDIVKVLEGI